MGLGRPITLTPNVKAKSISVQATDGQTSFTPTGGYRVNNINVYRNGARLSQGSDFTASDGATVTLLSAATASDVIAFQIFDTFAIADALNANGNQSIVGDLTITGTYTGDGSGLTGVANTDVVHTREITATGVSTFSSTIDANGVVDAASDVRISGNVNSAGISTFTGVLNASSDIRGSGNLNAGIATFSGLLNASSDIRGSGNINAGIATFSGLTKVSNATASSSTTTGALVVTGGIGVGGSVFLGDASGITFGAGKDLEILHDSGAGDSYIIDRGTGELKLDASSIVLQHAQSKRFETTPTGALVTGIATVTTKLVAAGLSYPTSDGSENQIIETDGSGTLSFVDKPSGGGGAGGDWLTNSLF